MTTIYTFYIESKVTTLKIAICDEVVLIISISINNINQYANNVASLKHKATFQTIFTQPFDYSTKEKLLKYFQSIQTDKVSFRESNRLEAKGILKMYFLLKAISLASGSTLTIQSHKRKQPQEIKGFEPIAYF